MFSFERVDHVLELTFLKLVLIVSNTIGTRNVSSLLWRNMCKVFEEVTSLFALLENFQLIFVSQYLFVKRFQTVSILSFRNLELVLVVSLLLIFLPVFILRIIKERQQILRRYIF